MACRNPPELVVLAATPPCFASVVPTVAALAVVASSGRVANHAEREGFARTGLFQRAGDKGEELLLQQLPPP